MDDTTRKTVSVEQRLAECEPIVLGVARDIARDTARRRDWLRAGGADFDDVAQVARVEVVRLAAVYPSLPRSHFARVAYRVLRVRAVDLIRSVGTQLGVRRARPGREAGIGVVKGRANPRHWVRLDAGRKSLRYDAGEDLDAFTPIHTDAECTDPPEVELRAWLRRIGAELTPAEGSVMSLVYGRGLNQKEAGKSLGLSASRVGQIHAQAVAKLHKCEQLRKYHQGERHEAADAP